MKDLCSVELAEKPALKYLKRVQYHRRRWSLWVDVCSESVSKEECKYFPQYGGIVDSGHVLTPPKSSGTNRIGKYLPDELVLIGSGKRIGKVEPV